MKRSTRRVLATVKRRRRREQHTPPSFNLPAGFKWADREGDGGYGFSNGLTEVLMASIPPYLIRQRAFIDLDDTGKTP